MKSWNELSMAERADVMKLAIEGGVYDLDAIRSGYNEFAEGGPKYKKSEQAYYDKNTDTIYAPDSIGEFYRHEMFHARPDSAELERLKPYYENLNDNRLLELGADLPFVKGMDNDPGHFYSPEEIGARVSAAKYMLNNAGINKVDNAFLEKARKNENAYGDNFRDLLHMYNNENLIGIFGNGYSSGGKIYIKPENRGKFTALKERTGHSATWFKEHGTPAQKKMAVFALNSKKWKHEDGGNLYPGGGFMGLLPVMPGIALTPSSNTLNIAKSAVKGAGRGISSFITGEGEPLREAGIAFIQNLNTQNKADALDAAMHSTQGGEVMGTNDLINIGIPNYFRKLTGQPMDINYTGSYLADGITPNVKRDLVNLYLKGDKTGFEDVTNNAFYNNGPDYVKYFRENYPNIKPRTYKMSSDGVPLELSEEEYAAATKNLNKNLRMKEDSRSNADNVANFNRWYKMIDGKLYAIDSDVWDFNPKDWAWEKGDEEMANSNGTPFILKAIRPVIKKKAIKRKALGGNLFSGEEGLI